MARGVLHLELPGVHVAAALELGWASDAAPVIVHGRQTVIDLTELPGVRRGQPLHVARRLAPQAQFVPAGSLVNAETYRAVWDQLCAVGPVVEPTARHAGYVDVSGCLPRRGAQVYLAQVAARLEALTRQPPACGVATNKLIARHASPHGVIIPPSEALGFLHGQRLRVGGGLTRPLVETLWELGCRRWGQVAEVPEPRLHALFGVQGTVLSRWSQGIDPRPVQDKYPPPVETAMVEVEPDEEGQYLQQLEHLAAMLAGRLQRRQMVCGEVVLSLGAKGLQQSHRRRLARGIDRPERIAEIALSLLPADLDPLAVDELRLTLRSLRRKEAVQGVLFSDDEEERRCLLEGAIARVRSRYGLTSLGPAPEVTGARERLAELVWRLEEVTCAG